MKNLSKSDKLIISGLLIWTLVNSYFLLVGFGNKTYTYFTEDDRGHTVELSANIPKVEYFFPYNNTTLLYYDYTEFLVYVIGAWLIFAIFKFITTKKGGTSNTKNLNPPVVKDRIELLKDLAQLKDSGVLTEAEFLKEKRRILESD